MNRWEEQKNANILAFLTAPEYQERKHTLERMCQTFSEHNVRWVLSCSSSLFFKGIVDDFHDFDVLVHIEDVEALKSAMSEMGANIELETVQKGYFTSPYYQQAQLGRVEFDMIGNITVNTFGGSYCYPVKTEETEIVSIDGNILVPTVAVEASLILYGMMEGWQARRKWKRELCTQYLLENGLEHKEILMDALDQGIPKWLQEVIRSLL